MIQAEIHSTMSLRSKCDYVDSRASIFWAVYQINALIIFGYMRGGVLFIEASDNASVRMFCVMFIDLPSIGMRVNGWLSKGFLVYWHMCAIPNVQ